MRQWRGVLSTALVVAVLLGVSLSGTWAAEKTKIRVVTFVYWNGVTGQETNDFIAKFKKEKGRDPNVDEMPRFTGLEWWDKVNAEYRKTHPNVEIEISTLDWATGRQRMDVQIAAGLAPDICVMAVMDAFKYYQKGLLDSIDLTAKERNELDQGQLMLGTYKGDLMAFPYERWAGYGFMINKRIFAERNALDLLPTGKERLWTYDQFRKALKATTFQRENGAQVYGYVPGSFNDWPWIFPFMWGEGVNIYDPQTGYLNHKDPRLAKGLQFLADLKLVDKAIPPNFISKAAYSDSAATALWNNNQAAVVLGRASFVKTARDDYKVGTSKVNPDDIVLVPYPTVSNSVEPRCYGAFNGFLMFKQKDQARKQQVLELIKFYANPENNLVMAKAQNTLPIRPSQAGEITRLWAPEDIWALEHLSKCNAPELAQCPYWQGARPLTYPILEAVLSGQMTAAEAFAKQGPKVNEWIDQQKAAAKQ